MANIRGNIYNRIVSCIVLNDVQAQRVVKHPPVADMIRVARKYNWIEMMLQALVNGPTHILSLP